MNNNEINVSLLISTNSESIPFPVDSDPSLKTDFENEGRLMVIFANPLSGSQEGLTIMELGGQYRSSTVNKYMVLKFPDCSSNVANETAKTMVSTSSNLREKSYRPAVFDPSITFSIVVFNILDKADFTKGKKFIKEYLNRYENNKIKILIGGGDGTVLSIVEDLNEDKVNLERCIFGAVPLGTGNDLSNALGFGGSMMFEQDEFFLFDLLFMYEIASESKIDIWNLELKVEDRKGRVCNIEKNKEQEIVEYNEKKEKNIPIKILNKTFINYCSIGYEARVGFSFEKIRSKNRIMNKWIYFWKALKKYTRCCRKNYALKNLVYSFQVGEAATSKPYTKQKNRFFTNNILYEINNSSSNIILNGDPISIVCQNINYYLGGSKDIWKNSGSNIGLTHLENNSEEEKNFLYEKANSEQRFDDKKLEFFTYESEVALGLENICSGHANKIYHGNGPVRIVFRKGVKDKVYLNIDGEYLRIYNPEYIKIKLDDRICNGQISFLRRFG